MRGYQDQFEERNVDVKVLTFDAQPLAAGYVKATGLSWPLLLDTERELYDAYGMKPGTWWAIANPVAIWKYVKLIVFRGSSLGRPGSDYRQLGGDVVIDPDGNIKWVYAGGGPHDRPSVKEVLRQLGITDER